MNVEFLGLGAMFGLMGVSVFTTMIFWGIMCFSMLLSIAMLVFMIWMLIHAIEHAPGDEKLVWVLIIIFVPFGPLIYFFVKREEFERKAAKSG